nr:hypothetical protein [Tanacetum cinerariifolium]
MLLPQVDFCPLTKLMVYKVETDTQEKDKNKAKNDKTKHIMEKIRKDSHSKPKVKSQSPRSTKVNLKNVKVNPDKAEAEK